MPLSPATTAISLTSSPRLAGLDGLRGIAILMVLVHHLTVFDATNGLPARLSILAEFCSHGVDLFFVLSGFLITDRLCADADQPGWARRFWVKRAAKIIPLYLACVAFVFLLLPTLLSATEATARLATQTNVQGNWPWYATFTSNFLNARDGRFTNPALDVCWSLGIEVQFYALAASWVWLRGIPTRRTLAALVAIAFVTRSIAVLNGADWIGILVLPWHRLDAFAFGGAIALGTWKWLGSPAARTLALITLAAPLILPWSRESWWVEMFGYSIVGAACAVAVFHASHPQTRSLAARLFENSFFRFCGTVSYSVYLTHLPVRAVLRDIVLPRVMRPVIGPSVLLQQAAFFLIAGPICLFLGWLVWRFFEEPVRRSIVQLCLRSASPRAVPMKIA